MSRDKMRNQNGGFTLMELLIVLAIVGLLTTLALPAYQKQVLASRRADCMAVLLGFAQAMEKFYALNFTYEGAGVGGANDGVAPAPSVYPEQCPLQGEAHYNLALKAGSVGPESYRLQALPVAAGPQADDGIMEIDHLGRRFWDKNGDGIWQDGEDNWER